LRGRLAAGIVEQQPVCSRCEAPDQRFGRRCPRCGKRYWGGGILRLLFGAGPPMKH
jgi:tRNA(Ile2) C34 agmatinyltransferase TiaS